MKDNNFEYTPRQMAERLMEFNRDFCIEDKEEVAIELNYLTKCFESLMKSNKYNGLVHHLDIMFMNSVFDGNDIFAKGTKND